MLGRKINLSSQKPINSVSCKDVDIPDNLTIKILARLLHNVCGRYTIYHEIINIINSNLCNIDIFILLNINFKSSSNIV